MTCRRPSALRWQGWCDPDSAESPATRRRSFPSSHRFFDNSDLLIRQRIQLVHQPVHHGALTPDPGLGKPLAQRELPIHQPRMPEASGDLGRFVVQDDHLPGTQGQSGVGAPGVGQLYCAASSTTAISSSLNPYNSYISRSVAATRQPSSSLAVHFAPVSDGNYSVRSRSPIRFAVSGASDLSSRSAERLMTTV